MIKRDDIHKEIDRQLDEWGYNGGIPYEWGELNINVKFEAGKVILQVRERITQKELNKK